MRSTPGYDVIGDVHGCGDLLVRLLVSMGYEERDGAFRHRQRQVVFVGDLVDRGPQQIQAVEIARAMVDAGTALIVAGNHEFNAIAYATEDPDEPGAFLRDHETKHYQHAEFLTQVGFGGALHREMIDWFMTLPLWLDLDGLRVVHASWDQTQIDAIQPHVGPGNSMTDELLVAASRHGSPEWKAIEHLLKGPEVPIDPPYRDKSGTTRQRARFKWWDRAATAPRTGAVIPANTLTVDGEPYPLETLSTDPIDKAEQIVAYTDDVPVIFGHYWEQGEPTVQSPLAACVDYSAVKGGSLVAYRWSGEGQLSNDNFTAIPSPQSW